MISRAILVEKLVSNCRRPDLDPKVLSESCRALMEEWRVDCVFLAAAQTPEEPLQPLAFAGKEEIMEASLYRLGVEERISLARLPLKAYSDVTGKPLFNKSGSLRIQKPGSGVFAVLNRPRQAYLLLGCADQNSKAYDQRLLEEISAVWSAWRETLAETLPRLMARPPKAPAAPPPASGVPAPVREAGEGGKKDDGRRPVLVVDEVTRLFNRDYFSESLSIEVERAKRYSRQMSLMFLCVSPAGAGIPVDENRVATQVAEILSRSLRRVDVICRLDRTKYAIILPDTAHQTYGVIARRIFKFFKQVMGDAPPVYLNVSASSYPQHAADPQALLASVEQLLDQAREVGPNKAMLPE
jgi:GGDEF domain-containing protein